MNQYQELKHYLENEKEYIHFSVEKEIIRKMVKVVEAAKIYAESNPDYYTEYTFLMDAIDELENK